MLDLEAYSIGLVEYGVNLVIQIISFMGYPGIFFLMTLESACIPIPSEIVMPFSGFLVFGGEFDFYAVTLAGTLGCTFGSVLAYYAGLAGGRRFIIRHGRYVLLNEDHLRLAERWFEKYGDKAIFFSRLMPIVRTFISLPAGIGRMNFNKFVVYTFAGSLPWCAALTYVGVKLGENWRAIEGTFHILDVFVVIGLIVVLMIYLRRRGEVV